MLNVQLRLTKLRCFIPQDYIGDEPYLWTFFFTVDGSTIRQTGKNSAHIRSNITITSNSGSHGNLNAKNVKYLDDIQIPDDVGLYRTNLKPITLEILNQTLYIPGSLGVFCVLMEEDATQDEPIERGRERVQDAIQDKLNNFFSSLNLLDISTQAKDNLDKNKQADPSSNDNLETEVTNIINVKLDEFVQQMTSEAKDLVEKEVLGSALDDVKSGNVVGAVGNILGNILDKDDLIATRRIISNERNIITENLEFHFREPLVEGGVHRTVGSYSGASYQIFGNITAGLDAGVDNIQYFSRVKPEIDHQFDVTVLKPDADGCARECLHESNKITASLIYNHGEWEFFLDQPFLDLPQLTQVWIVEGQELKHESGHIKVNKLCTFPEIDHEIERLSTSSQLIKFSTKPCKVTIGYRFEKRNGFNHLILTNNPSDGRYTFGVTLELELHNHRRIFIGGIQQGFDGQSIEVPAASCWEACFDKEIHDLPRLRGKSLSKKDFWGPYDLSKYYNVVVQLFDMVAHSQGIEQKVVDNVKNELAVRLHIDPRG